MSTSGVGVSGVGGSGVGVGVSFGVSSPGVGVGSFQVAVAGVGVRSFGVIPTGATFGVSLAALRIPKSSSSSSFAMVNSRDEIRTKSRDGPSSSDVLSVVEPRGLKRWFGNPEQGHVELRLDKTRSSSPKNPSFEAVLVRL